FQIIRSTGLRMRETALEVTAIYIYPVKSLRGVSLQQAKLENGRLVGDRNWILVDERGAFMHMRDYPRMARISANVSSGGIEVGMDGMRPLDIERPAFNANAPIEHVPLWRRFAPVTRVGPDADEWFTRALGVTCRLMAFAPDAAALHAPSYETNSSL